MILNILKGYYKFFKYYLVKSYRDKIEVEAERRMNICKKCNFFWKFGGNCMLCGCIMIIKTKSDFKLDENGISIEGCPEKYW